MSNRRAGVTYMSIDGVSYEIVEAANYKVSGVTRETVKGYSGVDGFKELPEQGMISAKVRDRVDLSLKSINAMTDVHVAMELANGKMVSGSAMWSIEVQEVDAGEGTFDLKFEGRDVREN